MTIASPLRFLQPTLLSSSTRVAGRIFMPQTRRCTRIVEETDTGAAQDGPPPKKARQSRAKRPLNKGAQDDSQSSRVSRKSKTSNNADPAKFLPRVNSWWKVGAHVSASGGVENAVVNAAAIGANAFALFLKSQRKWASPPLTKESIEAFKEKMFVHDYSPNVVLPHASYLINLGNPDAGKREKSYECFLDDLRRCELLGLKLYNFHPGSTVGAAKKEESISLIAQCINRAHKETTNVITVLENMAGAGNIIGSDFRDLKEIIDQVQDKSRVGVCLDTCHTFAAGYELRTEAGWNETLSKFDQQVGLSYLRAMHLNDSKMDLNSKKDRHENIGLGFLGVKTFRHILNDTRVRHIPLILETDSFEQPSETWGKEIALLQKISVPTAEADENRKALLSVIGKARTDEGLTEVIKNAVKSVQGKQSGGGQRRKGTKRKRKEESEDEETE